jgi:hypothetical protein
MRKDYKYKRGDVLIYEKLEITILDLFYSNDLYLMSGSWKYKMQVIGAAFYTKTGKPDPKIFIAEARAIDDNLDIIKMGE